MCIRDRYGSLFVKNDKVVKMVRSGAGIYAFSFLFSGINAVSYTHLQNACARRKENNNMSVKHNIVIPIGDIAGVGPEIVVKALNYRCV